MLKKTIKSMGNIIITLLIILSISALISIVQSKKDPGRTPSILGYKVMNVLSGSMEPSLKPGDVIVVKPIDPGKVKVNDVISYKNSRNHFVTHRVIEIVNKDEKRFFQTKGDANNIKDEGLVSSEQLGGSLLFHIPKVGYLANFLTSSLGYIVLITIPLLILTIGMFRKMNKTNKQQKTV
ncbi:signal peptidase I [Bacillus sp. FJAT-49736]|uniref:signal peptidase I n=1 Tax=Bacillus sp. FJAT-49736 TaxID=2833582 RepID=UPI001BC91B10|nr:signal peptidase I [Bacillus sp. FJAT-49736]MBS4171683.1 signal peptidase I [Bacillus sp. FJAT-49736]